MWAPGRPERRGIKSSRREGMRTGGRWAQKAIFRRTYERRSGRNLDWRHERGREVADDSQDTGLSDREDSGAS